MNPYTQLGAAIGTGEALALGTRLSAWHDAMVGHERGLRAGRPGASCDDECPHVEARALWSEAIEAFGDRAHELTFLRTRAAHDARRTTRDARRLTHDALRTTRYA